MSPAETKIKKQCINSNITKDYYKRKKERDTFEDKYIKYKSKGDETP